MLGEERRVRKGVWGVRKRSPRIREGRVRESEGCDRERKRFVRVNKGFEGRKKGSR